MSPPQAINYLSTINSHHGIEGVAHLCQDKGGLVVANAEVFCLVSDGQSNTAYFISGTHIHPVRFSVDRYSLEMNDSLWE